MMCDVVAQLRIEYPGWDFTLGSGEWIAARHRLLTEVEISCGLRHVLTAHSVDQLGGALAAQRVIELQNESGCAGGPCS